MDNEKKSSPRIIVFYLVGILLFGLVAAIQATSIGSDISTVNITGTGVTTLATSTISGTLGVTGTSTFTGAQTFTGASTFSSTGMFTGKVSVGTTTASTNTSLYVGGTSTIISTSYTPAASTTLCAAGSISWDADYIYTCISANTWRRASSTAGFGW